MLVAGLVGAGLDGLDGSGSGLDGAGAGLDGWMDGLDGLGGCEFELYTFADDHLMRG